MPNPLMPGPLYNAGAGLVGAFMGGDAVQEAARNKAQMGIYAEQAAEASLDTKITAAKQARTQRQESLELEQTFAEMNVPNPAAMAKAYRASGGNFNVMAGGLDGMLKMGLRQKGTDALLADPNVSDANAYLGGLQGKPLESVKISGGNVTRNIYGDTPDVGTTDFGMSQIAANRARAAASYASAGVSNVKAAAGGWKASAGKGEKTWTDGEVEAKLTFIEEQGKAMLAGGKPNSYVNAWKQNEMAKTGLLNATEADAADAAAAAAGGEWSGAPMLYDGAAVEGTPWKLPRVVPRVTNNGPNAAVTRQKAGDAAAGNQPSPLAPSVPVSKPAGVTPRPGTVMGGYRFKGGDPGNKANWEPV